MAAGPGLQVVNNSTGCFRRDWCIAGPSYNVAFFPKIYKAAGYPNILSHMRQQGAQEYEDPINWLLYQVEVLRM